MTSLALDFDVAVMTRGLHEEAERVQRSQSGAQSDAETVGEARI